MVPILPQGHINWHARSHHLHVCVYTHTKVYVSQDIHAYPCSALVDHVLFELPVCVLGHTQPQYGSVVICILTQQQPQSCKSGMKSCYSLFQKHWIKQMAKLLLWELNNFFESDFISFFLTHVSPGESQGISWGISQAKRSKVFTTLEFCK